MKLHLEWQTKTGKHVTSYHTQYLGYYYGLVYFNHNNWQCSVSVDTVGYDWEIKPTKQEAMDWCIDVIEQLAEGRTR